MIEKNTESKIDIRPDLWEYENKCIENGKTIIAGADEAGRGPLAGPVVAAAVIFDANTVINGINDSKKLTGKKRARLFNEIKQKCVCYSIAVADSILIDKLNILNAALLALKESVLTLSVKPDIALIDGNRAFDCGIEAVALIKGDSLSFSIAAASILAKVHRDNIMLEFDKKYPEYGFAKHKGYPVKAHYEAISLYGPCPIHRRSFRLY